MQRFLDEQFVIVADDGPLNGIFVSIGPSERIRRDDITGEPLPTEGEPDTVVVAEFVWPLKSRPESIVLLSGSPETSRFNRARQRLAESCALCATHSAPNPLFIGTATH